METRNIVIPMSIFKIHSSLAIDVIKIICPQAMNFIALVHGIL